MLKARPAPAAHTDEQKAQFNRAGCRRCHGAGS
jgi:cytochrome c551/c552